MQMVGHEQEQIWPPQKLFLPVTDGFEQSFGDIRQRELILETLFAVDGDEINLLLRIKPQWNLVRQRFALRDFHDWRIKHGHHAQQDRGDVLFF